MTAQTKKTQTKGSSRAANRKQNRRKSGLSGTVIGIIAVAVLSIAAVVIIAITSARPTGEIEGVQTFTNLDRTHTDQPVTYNQVPPVGGQHTSVWLNCGVYTQPVKNENAVHSLEHGAVWITYQEGLPQADLQRLQEITRGGTHRLLSPYPNLPSPIVASAWGYQLKLDSANDPRLMDFIKKYEQNPLGPEPGASCSGGVGEPS